MRNIFKKKQEASDVFTPVGTVDAPKISKKKKNYSKLSSSNFIVGGNAIFTFALIILFLAITIITSGRSSFLRPGPSLEDRIVFIARGSSLENMANTLEGSGVISDATVFQANTFRMAKNFKFGEYKIPKGASMEQIANILTEGKSITHRITLPEGLTSEQIVVRIYENDILSGDLTQIPVEGSILPSSYDFPRGMTRGQLIDQMKREQTRHLQRIFAARAPHSIVKTPEELVILASIVEKETGRADERARVAGVFSNRIRLGMKLQSDPTIIYGLVGGKGTLGRGILRSEIDKVTPYNTYQITGLPPTPIANPGVAAMEAVANPAKTRDLFFVADGTGGHAFAETLEQHNRNVVRWRQIEQKNKPQ